jgi:hypothetical protein
VRLKFETSRVSWPKICTAEANPGDFRRVGGLGEARISWIQSTLVAARNVIETGAVVWRRRPVADTIDRSRTAIAVSRAIGQVLGEAG